MNKKRLVLKNIFSYFFFFLLLISFGCAKRGSINGGLKDTIAPTLKVSFPKNFSTNFKEKTITLTFNEYIKLKNIEKEFVISPPMEKEPEISPTFATKLLTIKFKDTLRENTTYSLDFGKSIEDNNEGNPYRGFKYVFSTGTYIDSLTLNGTIKDAHDKKTATNLSVLLYDVNEKFTDSIIYKENPRYITKTVDSSKIFKFENLKAGKYLLVALKDENGNNKHDPRIEKIAFRKDYISIPNDTIFELKLFKETSKFQAYFPKQTSGNKITMGYQGNPSTMKVTLKNGSEIIPTIITKTQDKDSVDIWYKPLKADSLNVNVSNADYDKNFIAKIKNQKKDTLIVNSNSKNILPFREKFTLKSSVPLTNFDSTKMQLINKDSAAVAFKTEYDIWNQELKFDFEKEPNEKYKLSILPGALVDFMDQKNDSLSYKFDTRSKSDYGNLFLKIENIKQFPIIVELTNSKGDVIASEYSESSSKIDFNLIEPNKITVRVIYDANKNKEWDSGNYLEKIQPENVVIIEKGIDVRANWDVEQTINLGP